MGLFVSLLHNASLGGVSCAAPGETMRRIDGIGFAANFGDSRAVV
jgi:hypothetical protein